MAIEFFTGFEGCANYLDIHALGFTPTYSISGTYSSTGGFNSSKAMGLTHGYTSDKWLTVTKPVINTKTKSVGYHTRYVGTSNYSAEDGTALLLFITTTGTKIGIWNTSEGIKCYCDGILIGSSTTGIIYGDMTHIEAKCFSNATTGTFQVKVNGNLIIDENGLNTDGNDIATISWGSTRAYTKYATPIIFDNIYIADDNLQGELYSYLLKPSSDESVQFTPLSGTDNFAMLQSDDGDTSYVESDTVGHKDLYGYEDLPVNLVPLSATIILNARKEGTGLRQFQAISKQDLTEYDDSDVITLGTGYPASTANPSIIKVRSLAPDGTAWTREKINALQWGFKVAG